MSLGQLIQINAVKVLGKEEKNRRLYRRVGPTAVSPTAELRQRNSAAVEFHHKKVGRLINVFYLKSASPKTTSEIMTTKEP